MIEALLAGFLTSVIVTFLIMPSIIRTMRSHGMIGKDQKSTKPSK